MHSYLCRTLQVIPPVGGPKDARQVVSKHIPGGGCAGGNGGWVVSSLGILGGGGGSKKKESGLKKPLTPSQVTKPHKQRVLWKKKNRYEQGILGAGRTAEPTMIPSTLFRDTAQLRHLLNIRTGLLLPVSILASLSQVLQQLKGAVSTQNADSPA